ncbi:MAG: Nucleotidyltransferase family protein [Thermoproteota archaeon]|nr:Nucleotidyltransferase family protein [Thermoproteota archaeon]
MKQINVGVIPAAGRGNRLAELPLTRILPKPMLPLLNKPILEYVIENMKSVGVKNIYLIVGHKKELVKEYFRDGKDWDVEISYVEQHELKGIAHAISLTRDLVDEPFMVILGDDFTIARSFENMALAFCRNKAWVVEGIVVEDDVEILKRTCCVVLDEYTNKIIDINEKPSNVNSRLRGTGVYLFDPIVFEFIDKTTVSSSRNEKEISDTIGLMSKVGKAYGAMLDNVNININTFSDLMSATKLLLDVKMHANTS